MDNPPDLPALAPISDADAKKQEILEKLRWGDAVITSFSLPRYTVHLMSDEYLEYLYGEYCDYCICVFEICPETGRWHAHLYPIFNKNRPRWKKIKKIFGADCHIEQRISTRQNCVNYCKPSYFSKPRQQTKAEYTHMCGPFVFGTFRDQGVRADQKIIRAAIWASDSWPAFMRSEWSLNKWVISHLNWCKEVYACKPQPNLTLNLVLKPVQVVWWKELQALRARNNKNVGSMGRQVIVVCDPFGGRYKSVFATWIVDNQGAYEAAGKVRDVIHGYESNPYVLFDLVRTHKTYKSDAKPWFPTTMLELFCNGRLCNTKYFVFNKRFIAPGLIVFTNEWDLPLNDLTDDRWLIFRCHKTKMYKNEVYNIGTTKKVENVLDDGEFVLALEPPRKRKRAAPMFQAAKKIRAGVYIPSMEQEQEVRSFS